MTYPHARFDRLCRHLESATSRVCGAVLVLAGVIIEFRLLGGLSSPGIITAFVAVIGFFIAYGLDLTIVDPRPGKLSFAGCGLTLVVVTVGLIPRAPGYGIL